MFLAGTTWSATRNVNSNKTCGHVGVPGVQCFAILRAGSQVLVQGKREAPKMIELLLSAPNKERNTSKLIRHIIYNYLPHVSHVYNTY